MSDTDFVLKINQELLEIQKTLDEIEKQGDM